MNQADYDLKVLAAIRRRGKAPGMPIMVTDNGTWHRDLIEFGCLCVRVDHPGDCDHDWSPLRGLHCILLQGRGDYAALGQALLSAAPACLETYQASNWRTWLLPSCTVLGPGPTHADRSRRDYLLGKVLLQADRIRHGGREVMMA